MSIGRWVGEGYGLSGIRKVTGETVHEIAGAVTRQDGGQDANFPVLTAQVRF